MLFIQNKKLSLLIVIAFLLVVLQGFHTQVQAESTDKSDIAQTLWEQGKIAFNARDYQTALEKFNESLTIYRELGDQQTEADILTWIANAYLYLSDLNNVLNYLKESQGIYKELNSSSGGKPAFKDVAKTAKVVTFLTKGLNFLDAKDYEATLKEFKKALRLARETEERLHVAFVLHLIFNVYFGLENYSDAEDYCRQALIIYSELGEKWREGDLLVGMGNMYLVKGEGEVSKSLEYYKKALEIFEQVDDKDSIANTLSLIGDCYFICGDYSSDQTFTEKALALFLEVEDKEGMANTTLSLGITHRLQGSFDMALNYLKEALRIVQEIGKSPCLDGGIIYQIGLVYSEMGKTKEALEALNEAMLKFKEHNSIIDQGVALIYHGMVNSKMENYLEAISNIEEGLNILDNIKVESFIEKERTEDQRLGLYTLEQLYTRLGDDVKAKECVLRIKRIKEAHGNIKMNQMLSLMDSGRILFNENRFDKALVNYKQALALSKEIGHKQNEGMLLSYIGDTYFFMGEYSEALDFYRQSVKFSRKQKDKGTGLGALNMMANSYYQQQDYQNALDYYEQALAMAKEIGDKYSEMELVYMIACVYGKQKKYEKEVEYEERALMLSRGIYYHNMTWHLLFFLGSGASISGQLEKAKSYYSEAINIIESIREKISAEKHKIGFMEKGNKSSVYDSMIDVLWELKEYEEAFNYLERAKSRSLLDLLGNKLKFEKVKDKELSQEEMKLQNKIKELLEKIRKEHSQPKEKQRTLLKELNKEAEQARKEYANLLMNIKQENPELYSVVNVNPLTLKEVQELIEPDTTLLEYFLSGSNSHSNILFLYCWVINKNEYKLLFQNVSESASKIISFREKIVTLQSDYEKESEELYDLLIRPAKPYIKTKRICIVPHSVLHYLPFQALINTDETKNESGDHPRFLIEEYDIFYAPSASVLKFVLEKRKKCSGKVLAFGNPELGDENLNLPHAEEEIKRIKESYPETDLYFKENATEEKVKLLSGDYDIIHFASHGELNPKSPLFSCIKMAKEKDEDGRLEVHEIFNLDLKNASLVTLSACETGLGKLSSGDELIGLTRGFIYAGTPSIVASLWNVNDKSTSDLMGLFYKNLKTHSKAEALRLAQLEMINGEIGRGIVRGVGGITTSKEGQDNPQTTRTVNGSHPYFWASFILLGDWK